MTLSTNEHTAAARRAASRQRVSGATVLHASDEHGQNYVLVMVTTKEPGKGYLVARDKKTGAWTCSCFAARWQGLCDHLEAVRLHDAKAPLTKGTKTMNPIQTRPTDADADAEPERLVPGPSGTKILQTPAAARAMKARGRGHAGMKVFPRPASTSDAGDRSAADKGKGDAT